MFIIDKIVPPQLGLTGFEADLSEEDRAIQANVQRFAKEIMRPIGEQLDKVTPEQVIADDSPLWDFYRQLNDSGLFDLEMLSSLSDQEKSRILPIVLESMFSHNDINIYPTRGIPSGWIYNRWSLRCND